MEFVLKETWDALQSCRQSTDLTPSVYSSDDLPPAVLVSSFYSRISISITVNCKSNKRPVLNSSANVSFRDAALQSLHAVWIPMVQWNFGGVKTCRPLSGYFYSYESSRAATAPLECGCDIAAIQERF